MTLTRSWIEMLWMRPGASPEKLELQKMIRRKIGTLARGKAYSLAPCSRSGRARAEYVARIRNMPACCGGYSLLKILGGKRSWPWEIKCISV